MVSTVIYRNYLELVVVFQSIVTFSWYCKNMSIRSRVIMLIEDIIHVVCFSC